MRVDELVLALRERDALRARVLYSLLAEQDLATLEPPTHPGELERAIAASIVELLANRSGASAPAWTKSVDALSAPYALVTVRSAARLARLQRETPQELRSRNLIAPENFLRSV